MAASASASSYAELDENEEDVLRETWDASLRLRHFASLEGCRQDLQRHRGFAGVPPGVESSAYMRDESPQYIKYVLDQVHKLGQDHAGRLKGGFRWMVLVLIGVSTAVVGLGMDMCVMLLFRLRHWVIEYLIHRDASVWLQFISFTVIATLLSAVAAFLVCFVEPLAAGSGIPEIKCDLNGVDRRQVEHPRTLLCKATGIAFSVASGLPAGKEGPMIHSGAIIGAIMSYIHAGPLVRPYRLEKEKRDLITAGAAAGVAAAFGAPLGGVLFALEEGSTHMNSRIMVRTFVTAAVAALLVRLVLTPLETGEFFLLGSAAISNFGSIEQEIYKLWELVFFAVIGLVSGLLGALFIRLNLVLSKWRQRHVLRGARWKRFLEALLLTFVVASVSFWAAVWADGGVEEVMKGETLSFTLYWDAEDEAIQRLIHNPDVHFSESVLVWKVVTNYIFGCLVYGLGVPSGLFMPSLLTGAGMGRIVGQRLWSLDIPGLLAASPGTYAIVGACGFLAGVGRVTISLAAIVMEATAQIRLAVPLFLVVTVATWVGNMFGPGIYDAHIELQRVPLLELRPAKALRLLALQARDVMVKEVRCVRMVMTVRELVDLLRATGHHGFPMQAPTTGRFAGLVRRGALHHALANGHRFGALQAPRGVLASPPPFVPFDEVARKYPSFPSLEQVLSELEPEDFDRRVDLRPYADTGAITVRDCATVSRCYDLFRGMGLRHLPVIAADGTVCGMITRKDLLLFDAPKEEPSIDSDGEDDEEQDEEEDSTDGEEDDASYEGMRRGDSE